MPLEQHVSAGTISILSVDPAELAPDEFIHKVRNAITEGARVIVIDSVNGYFLAMPEAKFLMLQLHELLSFTASHGVVTLLTMSQAGAMGSAMNVPVDVSYLADTILLFRYFEAQGRVRKALSVLKKRSGRHDDTIRELSFSPAGAHVGAPLPNFIGILTGVPSVVPEAEGKNSHDTAC